MQFSKIFVPLHSLTKGNHIGELAEWSNAAVLKTVDLNGSGGSNPSLSARMKVQTKKVLGYQLVKDFFFYTIWHKVSVFDGIICDQFGFQFFVAI